jgi:hypothetical protein
MAATTMPATTMPAKTLAVTTMAATTTQDLLENIDEISAKYLIEEWTGSITFKVDVGGLGWLQEVDICQQQIGSNNKMGFNKKLYLDSIKYPLLHQVPYQRRIQPGFAY